jgi:ferredoxin-like protein FixX
MQGLTFREGSTRDDFVDSAKLAFQAGRYDDMAGFMRDATLVSPKELTAAEGNLLVMAYKKAVTAHIERWKLMKRREDAGDEVDTDATKAKTERVLSALIFDMDDIMNMHLFHSARMTCSRETEILYHWFNGDIETYMDQCFECGLNVVIGGRKHRQEDECSVRRRCFTPFQSRVVATKRAYELMEANDEEVIARERQFLMEKRRKRLNMIQGVVWGRWMVGILDAESNADIDAATAAYNYSENQMERLGINKALSDLEMTGECSDPHGLFDAP